LDTAFSFRGPLGIIIYPGAKNLETTSCVVFLSGDPSLSDPDNVNEVRNYIYGRTSYGELLDPCTWAYGQVRGGVNCNQVNSLFWCSGDPVTDVGWIFDDHRDVRGAGSTGPFKLIKNQEVEILIGYEIDRSTTPLSGITAVRLISDAVQTFYENNFGYPIVSIEDEQPAFSNFSLEQNFPNPFNPSTKISWQLPVGSQQTLKIYDVLGNEITTLIDEYKPAGRYEIEFNASSLPSGVYFYQLKAGDYIDTKKMILLK
jgi:hypothetical protein